MNYWGVAHSGSHPTFLREVGGGDKSKVISAIKISVMWVENVGKCR